MVDVTDLKEQAIDDQITVGELYEQTKLQVLRFYLTTKKKIIPSDTQSDTHTHTHTHTVPLQQRNNCAEVENMQDSWSPTRTSQSALFSENVEPDLIYVGSSAAIATGSDGFLSDSITSVTDVSSVIDAAMQTARGGQSGG